MCKNLKKIFSVSLILLFPLLIKAEVVSENSVENNENVLLNETGLNSLISSLYSTNSFPVVNNSNGDNFFRRLFRGNRTVAERRSQSKEHPTTRRQSYRPPESNSQLPMGSSGSTNVRSTENVAVENVQKSPLGVSRRDQEMGTRPITWEIGINVGSAHAVTDIGNAKNMAFGDFMGYQTDNYGLNFGLYTKRLLSSWLGVSFGMDYGSYGGHHSCSTLADSDYYGYRFENNVFEFFGKLELHAPFLERKAFDLYGFTGIGVFFNDLRLFNEQNRPVTIETDFNQVQPAIPVGLGFGYVINNQVRIGYELGYRYTMFNFFDGVGDKGSVNDRYFSNVLKVGIVF